MSNKLVIVESPAKAKTIEKFLGPGYRVLASFGHVRALPSKQGSVDIENGFEPKYAVLPESKKHLDAIKKELKTADTLLLATDPDREGEAISWHLLAALGLTGKKNSIPVKRVVFHEITKGAIVEAVQNPRDISLELVDAQQARSVLDYLVGFNLSPFLWKKIRYGLSAGRVQSVALRLVCEREKEIQAFIEQEYWTIGAKLAGKAAQSFKANLIEAAGKKLAKFDIPDKGSSGQACSSPCNRPFTGLKKSQKANGSGSRPHRLRLRPCSRRLQESSVFLPERPCQLPRSSTRGLMSAKGRSVSLPICVPIALLSPIRRLMRQSR